MSRLVHNLKIWLAVFITASLVACGSGDDYEGFDASLDSATPDDFLKFFLYVLSVYQNLLPLQFLGVKGNIIEESLHHRVKPPRPNALGARVDVVGYLGNLLDSILLENKLNTFCVH